ncbi:MAG: LVIVD repeat-containing protein [Cytophagaceae bacterium]
MRKYILILSLVLLWSCDKADNTSPGSSNSSAGGSSGIGGSLARFAVVNNNMFVLTENELHCLSVQNPSKPDFISKYNVGWGMETIFPKDTLLFLGSEWGMHIYDISNPTRPLKLSVYEHIISCDPVVADDNYAYVTLRTGTTCMRGVNRLEIVDISNVRNPFLVKEYPMTNPHGLGIDQHSLFVCDNGLKVYDASNVNEIVLKKHFSINAKDVIPYNGLLMVMADDGLYQYRYENEEINLLSKIGIGNE